MYFTYVDEEHCDKATLRQGDVLRLTPELEGYLKETHPGLLTNDPRYFLVVTQTCDLVRRGTACASTTIAVSAILPLSAYIDREMRLLQGTDIERRGRFCSASRRESMKKSLERLFNNNETEYFYLHQDAMVQFPSSGVAFLRLSASLRAEDCYDICVKAKHLELNEVFSSKLGFIVGHLFSRVATDDWVPKGGTTAEFEAMVKESLQQVEWVEPRLLDAARAGFAAEELGAMSPEAILSKVQAVKLTTGSEVLYSALRTATDNEIRVALDKGINSLVASAATTGSLSVDWMQTALRDHIDKPVREAIQRTIKIVAKNPQMKSALKAHP